MRGAANNQAHLKTNSGFLLTRLMRGAAGTGTEPNEGYIHFYSRASCEARQRDADAEVAAAPFLLTRLMRGAAKQISTVNRRNTFLLTRLMRGAAD